MTRALVSIGKSSVSADVDVYRDGDVVTIVARGESNRTTPFGNVRSQGVVSHQYDTVEAFEYDRDRMFKRFPLAYARVVGRLGIDDDARRAPPLPANLRHLLPEHQRALSAQSDREPQGRPYLLASGTNGSRR